MQQMVAAVVSLGVLAACGGDDGDSDGGDAGAGAADPKIEVGVDADIPSIVKVHDVTCRRADDTRLVASGIVSSAGESTQYVNLQVRFLDGDGVRVELASDSVSDLRVGESARWDATAYADGAPDVRRCEVTAAVS
jgi:hypothetical protein